LFELYLNIDEEVETMGRGNQDTRIPIFTRLVLLCMNNFLYSYNFTRLYNNLLTYNTKLLFSLCDVADPERFRFARETSFGRRHLSFWTKNPVLMWIVSQIYYIYFDNLMSRIIAPLI